MSLRVSVFRIDLKWWTFCKLIKLLFRKHYVSKTFFFDQYVSKTIYHT